MEEMNAITSSLKRLGEILKGWCDDEAVRGMYDFRGRIEDRIQQAAAMNPWFIRENIHQALQSWAKALQPESVDHWVAMYPSMHRSVAVVPKTVAIVMAGNIPLVGFHDLLSVLVSGHKAIVKLSDSDRILIPLMVEILKDLVPAVNEKVKFSEGPINGFDAVIATGSDNTFRYFDHYFGKYPHIIRKNRNSIAVLDGRESFADLDDLCHDIFSYFGMGCRNVSKLLVPRGYSFDDLLTLFSAWNHVGNHHHYRNNYDYRKSIMLINSIPFIDHPNILLTEHEGLTSPLAVLHYSCYDSQDQVEQFMLTHANAIQCVVGNDCVGLQTVPFGKTQCPALWDYADGVDTMAFLLGL